MVEPVGRIVEISDSNPKLRKMQKVPVIREKQEALNQRAAEGGGKLRGVENIP